MTTALIGYTGFVGGNLLRQYEFADLYNSANIETIAGRAYDLIVCAGAPGVKWKANKEPDQDWNSIRRLASALERARATEFVLISTVDVYPSPVGVDEGTPIDEQACAPYGRHRLLLERLVQEQFPASVIRLPGLFGHGLKKNVIYDLLHGNALDLVCPDSVYQFYPLDHLWRDVSRVRNCRIPVVNFATEGVSVGELAREVFGIDFKNPAVTQAARYDFRTKFSYRFDRTGEYLYSRREVLESMSAFVSSYQAARYQVAPL